MMSVFEDYRDRRFDRYFTSNFIAKHLSFGAIPIGGHQQYRERARAGNVGLNLRHRNGQPADVNSIIFDLDLRTNSRQVFRLMQEVEARNASNFYRDNAGGNNSMVSGDEYYINTTATGSRQWFVKRKFRYGVIPVGGRYVINHYDGDERD